MKPYRVVYTGKSDREPGQDQLHDVKFETREEAVNFARQPVVQKGLVYVQFFADDGTPIETFKPSGGDKDGQP